MHHDATHTKGDIMDIIDAATEARRNGTQLVVICDDDDSAGAVVSSVHLLTDARAVSVTDNLTDDQRDLVEAYVAMPESHPDVVATTAWPPTPGPVAMVRHTLQLQTAAMHAVVV